jgi:hypothetical protein
VNSPAVEAATMVTDGKDSCIALVKGPSDCCVEAMRTMRAGEPSPSFRRRSCVRRAEASDALPRAKLVAMMVMVRLRVDRVESPD